MIKSAEKKGDSSLLFFILVYLLPFYDGTAIGLEKKGDSSVLFFILVFLLLFY